METIIMKNIEIHFRNLRISANFSILDITWINDLSRNFLTIIITLFFSQLYWFLLKLLWRFCSEEEWQYISPIFPNTQHAFFSIIHDISSPDKIQTGASLTYQDELNQLLCMAWIRNHIHIRMYCCLSGKLWYLQHNCVGDTIVYQ